MVAVTPVGQRHGGLRPSSSSRRSTLTSDRNKQRRFALTPLVVILGGMTLVPTAYMLVVSVTDKAATNPTTRFVFLRNYTELLSNPGYWAVLGRTLLFVVPAVLLQLTLAVVLAVSMSGVVRGASLLRMLILLPMAVAPIAVIFTWRIMLNASYGVVNYLLGLLQLPTPDWLGTPSLALATLVVIDTWQWTPFIFIILAGGLAGIPQELYDAAAIDRANGWQTFWHITFPLLLPFIAVAVLFRTIDALKTFDAVQVLTAGGPGSSTTMLNYSIIQEGINFLNFGKASASAVLFLVLSVVLSKVLLGRLRRRGS
jgi:multiple sugar transport system permease protein